MKEKETPVERGKFKKELFGLDPEMSLQNVNFAGSENSYLNEHYQEDAEE